MEALSALWTFPAIILAAMLITWAAECGQFFISQGLALAVLAFTGIMAVGPARLVAAAHSLAAAWRAWRKRRAETAAAAAAVREERESLQQEQAKRAVKEPASQIFQVFADGHSRGQVVVGFRGGQVVVGFRRGQVVGARFLFGRGLLNR